MAQIIDGKAVAESCREKIRFQTEELRKIGKIPGLAVILIGNDSASKIYVRNKKLACEQVGFRSFEYLLPETTELDSLLSLIQELNQNPDIDGILVQAPIPAHLDFQKVTASIAPDKDVDAFHPYNVGKIMSGDPYFLPCTPAGVMELIHSTGVSVEGKECVVVGRSNIVGKPMAMMLLRENGTVTICHSKTADLGAVTRRADILIVAVGKSRIIRSDMIKPGAIVIDVGMNRDSDGKLTGDVDFEEAIKVASAITPVPGGVGPMTITMLLENTLTAAKNHTLKN